MIRFRLDMMLVRICQLVVGVTLPNFLHEKNPKCDSSRPDLLIIGGGPSGSAAAAFLAMKGRHVVLVEKDAHQRSPIGESLLPHNLDNFERLGVLDQGRKIGVHTSGAQFVSDRCHGLARSLLRNAFPRLWQAASEGSGEARPLAAKRLSLPRAAICAYRGAPASWRSASCSTASNNGQSAVSSVHTRSASARCRPRSKAASARP